MAEPNKVARDTALALRRLAVQHNSRAVGASWEHHARIATTLSNAADLLDQQAQALADADQAGYERGRREAMKAEVKRRLAARPKLVAPTPAPRYDKTFYEGLASLDRSDLSPLPVKEKP